MKNRNTLHVVKWKWTWKWICVPTEHLKSAQELVQHVSVHSGSNWNLAVLVFEERGKPEYPEKNLSEQGENQQQTQPTYDAGVGNRTRATLVEGECSHHCATPAPLEMKSIC